MRFFWQASKLHMSYKSLARLWPPLARTMPVPGGVCFKPSNVWPKGACGLSPNTLGWYLLTWCRTSAHLCTAWYQTPNSQTPWRKHWLCRRSTTLPSPLYCFEGLQGFRHTARPLQSWGRVATVHLGPFSEDSHWSNHLGCPCPHWWK